MVNGIREELFQSLSEPAYLLLRGIDGRPAARLSGPYPAKGRAATVAVAGPSASVSCVPGSRKSRCT